MYIERPALPSDGGTGTTTAPTSGQIPIGKSTGVYTPATVTAGSTKITISAGSGSLSIDVNQANLSLSSIGGSIALGSQVSGTLPTGNGGTGITTSPTDGMLMIGSTSGSKYVGATLTAGSTKLSITNAGGSITLDVNQANLSLGSIGGSITLTTQVTGLLQIVNGGTGIDGTTYTAKSSSFTAVAGNAYNNATGSLTITLPTAVGVIGQSIYYLCTVAATTTVNTTSSQKVSGVASGSLTFVSTTTNQVFIEFLSDGANWQYISTPIGNGAGGPGGILPAANLPATAVNSVGNLSPLFTASISAQALSFSLSAATNPSWFGANGSTTPAYQTGAMPIALGGTNATTAAAALTNLGGMPTIACSTASTPQSVNVTAVVNTYYLCDTQWSNGGATFTITLPTAVGNKGAIIGVSLDTASTIGGGNGTSQPVIINTTSSQSISGFASGKILIDTTVPWWFISDGTNWQILACPSAPTCYIQKSTSFTADGPSGTTYALGASGITITLASVPYGTIHKYLYQAGVAMTATATFSGTVYPPNGNASGLITTFPKVSGNIEMIYTESGWMIC